MKELGAFLFPEFYFKHYSAVNEFGIYRSSIRFGNRSGNRKSNSVAAVFLCTCFVTAIETVKKLVRLCVGKLGACVKKLKLHMPLALVNRNIEFMLII